LPLQTPAITTADVVAEARGATRLVPFRQLPVILSDQG